MTTVTLKSPKQLGSAIRRLNRGVERELNRAMVKAARFGRAAVVRTAQTTKPRPRATGTYIRSWLVTRVRDGGVLSNSAEHAVFPERGRQAGIRPPTKAILTWVRVKKIKPRRRAGESRAQAERRLALAIARKIGREGTPGRWVLKRTMPIIEAEAKRQSRKAIARAISRQG